MTGIKRLFTNILTDDLVATRDFYVGLLEMKAHFDSDWFVILVPAQGPMLELGIIDRNHEIVPPDFRASPQGAYLTFVVNDVEPVFARAQAMDVEIVQPPRDEFYGQRRLLLTDPNGLLVDVSSPTPRQN